MNTGIYMPRVIGPGWVYSREHQIEKESKRETVRRKWHVLDYEKSAVARGKTKQKKAFFRCAWRSR